MAKRKRKPAEDLGAADLVGTPVVAAAAAEVAASATEVVAVARPEIAPVGTPEPHYTDALPCDHRMRRSVAKLLRAGVPLSWTEAQFVAGQLPEAAVREVMRHELDWDLSQLYARLTSR